MPRRQSLAATARDIPAFLREQLLQSLLWARLPQQSWKSMQDRYQRAEQLHQDKIYSYLSWSLDRQTSRQCLAEHHSNALPYWLHRSRASRASPKIEDQTRDRHLSPLAYL